MNDVEQLSIQFARRTYSRSFEQAPAGLRLSDAGPCHATTTLASLKFDRGRIQQYDARRVSKMETSFDVDADAACKPGETQ